MSTATHRRPLNPVSRVRHDAQEEIDRLHTLLTEAQGFVKNLEFERDSLKGQCTQLNGELQDALRAKLTQADQIEKLLREVDAYSKDVVRLREAIGAFLTNVNADVKVLMGAIK